MLSHAAPNFKYIDWLSRPEMKQYLCGIALSG